MKNKFNRCCCGDVVYIIASDPTGDHLGQVYFDDPATGTHTIRHLNPIINILNGYGIKAGVSFSLLNASIPQGSTIVSAKLAFRAWSIYPSDIFEVKLQGVVRDAGTVVQEANLSIAQVLWNQTGIAWVRGDRPDIPDVAAIVQEIVDDPMWTGTGDIYVLMQPVAFPIDRSVTAWGPAVTITYR